MKAKGMHCRAACMAAGALLVAAWPLGPDLYSHVYLSSMAIYSLKARPLPR